MDIIDNTQTNSKTFLKKGSMIIAIAFTLGLSITLSNTYAEPPRGGANCTTTDKTDYWEVLWCCWTETDPTDPEKIEIKKCQSCEIIDGNVDCSPPVPDPNPAPPTTREDISPGNTGVIEEPPTTDNQPIKSGDAVAPNDGNNAIDEQQPNPSSPLNDQRIPPGNVGVLEQLDDSSNNEQSQESEESTDTNNVETTSNLQEIDESSNSETTNSLSKRGNTQNSPVPPECPKQGPIPPDCTMKPKF